jgi:hypothetical protein
MQAERRKNFRCPPSNDAETVVLRLKGIDRTAKVVNLSAEGFRISFETEDGIEQAQVGDVALLGTRHGSHQVRVANVQCENGAVQLGLERLADFSRPSHRVRRKDPSKGHVGGGRRFGDPSSSLFVKVAIVAAVALLGIVAVNLTLTARGNSSHRAVVDKGKVPAIGAGQTAARSSRIDDPPSSETRTVRESFQREPVLEEPTFDASIKIAAALKRASRENKLVLVEFGNEKCESCYRLHDFITKNAEFAAAFERDFVLVLVDKAANQALFNRLVPAEHQKDVSFLSLLDKDGRSVKGEKTEEVASGPGFDINRVKAVLQPPTAPKK